MAAVAVKYPAFRELQAEILAISVDSIDSHQRWNDEELCQLVQGGAGFPLLEDRQGSIGRQYGVFDEEKNIDSRGRFLIDPEGIVQAMEVIADVSGRNVSEILRQLRALQYNRETGAFMPCGWEPGKPTIPSDLGDHPRISERWKTRMAF